MGTYPSSEETRVQLSLGSLHVPTARSFFGVNSGNLLSESLNRNRLYSIESPPVKITSLNVGLPREVTWHNRVVSTGIFKEPVSGRLALRTLNLDGDRQADLTVHGGTHKAVYCYPSEHYDFWKRELPGRDLPTAIFGENFTVDEMFEDSLYLGDRFRIGTAEVVVTQPRQPCFKLGIRFQNDHMVKRFLAAGRSGFYLAVTKEGEVGAGDVFTPLGRDPNQVPVSELTRLFIAKSYKTADVAVVRRLVQVSAVPEDWKYFFSDRLDQTSS